ncbi:hypothetical protein FISHEDRAFT_56736 [Fistulina hepatica ATCC 64428]|uniref:Uncharacterized protein n=1 Tax=Fistulina hepatica ATCC 64428 TaxID=1128425 RepID=A0A0D7AHY8_9AGAR|nr:hypothetical protein FISHEDRAFT_56736 [Fistulina hepatica ATCC 64428]
MDSWDVIEAVSASPQCPVTTQLTSTFSTVSYEYGAYTATHLPCKVAKLDFDTPSRRTDTLPTDFESIPAIAATDKASSEVRIVAPLLPGIVIDSGDAADVRPRSPVLPTSSPSPKSNIDNAGHIVSDSGSGGCPIGALAYARSQPRDIIPRTPLLLDQHCEADVMAQDDDGLSTRAPTMEFLSGHTHRSVEGTSRQTAAAFGPPTYDHQPEKERQAPNNNSLPIGGKKSTLSPSPPPSHQIPTGPKLLVVEPVLDVIVDADDRLVSFARRFHYTKRTAASLSRAATITPVYWTWSSGWCLSPTDLDLLAGMNSVKWWNISISMSQRGKTEFSYLITWQCASRRRRTTCRFTHRIPVHGRALISLAGLHTALRWGPRGRWPPSSTPTLPAGPPPPASQPVVAPRKRRRKPRLNKDGLIAVHSHLTGAGRQERSRPSSLHPHTIIQYVHTRVLCASLKQERMNHMYTGTNVEIQR